MTTATAVATTFSIVAITFMSVASTAATAASVYILTVQTICEFFLSSFTYGQDLSGEM
jgi:hypothetical protein